MWVAYEMLLTLCRSFAHTRRDRGISVCVRRNWRKKRAVVNRNEGKKRIEARKHVRVVVSDEAKRRCKQQGVHAIQRHTNAKAPHLVQRRSLSDTRSCGHRGAPTVA